MPNPVILVLALNFLKVAWDRECSEGARSLAFVSLHFREYHRKMKPDILRMVFGFSLLMILAGIALAIALGHVEEKTSYGLMPLLTSLSTLAGIFAQWAFGGKDKSE